jgi:hypothetical protein
MVDGGAVEQRRPATLDDPSSMADGSGRRRWSGSDMGHDGLGRAAAMAALCCSVVNDDGFAENSGLVPRHEDAKGGCHGHGGGGLILRRRWLAGWSRRRVREAQMPVKTLNCSMLNLSPLTKQK